MLLPCCSQKLKSNAYRANPRFTTQAEQEVLDAIKSYAVVSLAASVLRTAGCGVDVEMLYMTILMSTFMIIIDIIILHE